jgi:CRP/FNR family cyclic AMP-dependent transcriptional regulator
MANKRSPGLSPIVLRKKFGAGMTTRNYRDKEIVFSQGDTADAVFYIQSGTGETHGALYASQESYNRLPAARQLFRAKAVSEGNLCGSAGRDQIAQSSITRLRKESMVRALKRDPQFAAQFVAYLLSRIVRIEEDLVDQFFNFSERRLARVLLLFGQIIKESKPEYPLKVSQSTLAEMVGTTRARVSKFMNVFKKKGLVSYNGGLQINPLTAFLQNRPLSVSTKA